MEDDEYDLKDVDVEEANSSSSASDEEEYSVEFVNEEEGSATDEEGYTTALSDIDSEYGERTLEPQTVTRGSTMDKNEFYQTSVRRQNCFFGGSMLMFAGLFVVAYFYMGLSFTPSNIGIFGDESAMKGSAGKLFV